MTKKRKKYSAGFKLQAVHEYLGGKGSLRKICKKYGIPDHKMLRQWILCYNGHKEMRRPSGARGEIYMTKGRKTPQEERAQIVAFCIEHGKDYALTVFHSDRGFQYTSRTFYNKLQKAKMRQSMSKVGRCIDNGPMESFWGMLKSEMYYLHRFTDKEELIQAIENYIQFYNNGRYQKRLHCMTPMEFHFAYAA